MTTAMKTKFEIDVHKIAEELWCGRLMSDGRRAIELVRSVHATGTDAYPKAVEYARKRLKELGWTIPDCNVAKS